PISHTEVARAQALLPGQPLGCDERVRSGQQHRLVDGDVLGPGGAHHRDRVVPARIGGIQALEEVGDQAVVLDLGAEVLTDPLGASDLGGRRTSEILRLDTRLVWYGGSTGASHVSIFADYEHRLDHRGDRYPTVTGSI